MRTLMMGALFVAVMAACGGGSGKQASTMTTAFVASAATCPTHMAEAWTADDHVKIARLSSEQSTACSRWLIAQTTTTTTAWVPSADVCPTHDADHLTGEDNAKIARLQGERLSACARWFTNLPTTTTTEAPTTTTQPSMVEYKVTGGNMNITYSDPSDGTIQQVTVHGPWSKSWPDNGGFYSISVQNEVGNSGPNSCTITVGGEVKSTHSASGYNIADCKG